jgi:predicted TIM-barrel fold metal-dependent hydrolase
MFIFDCHVHLPSPGLNLTWEWEPFTPDIPSAIKYLRRCGVNLVLANSMRGEIASTPEEMKAANDEIAQAASDFPDFIVPACLINTNFPEQSLLELERCSKELNIAWIGELCGYAGGYTYDTHAFGQAVALATRLEMVIHIHNDDDADMDRLCLEFPKTTFVLAHLGDGPDEVQRRIDLTTRHPNLYLDICGNGFERMGILEKAVKTAGAERVLFGSDFTINDPAGVIARIEHSDHDEETRRKILGGNLTRLLSERGIELPELNRGRLSGNR